MNISTLLLAVETALKPIVEALNGSVEMCVTPVDVLEKLKVSPEKWRCLVSWDGGDNFNPFGSADKTRIQVVIQAARGLAFDPGQAILRGNEVSSALLDKIEAVQGAVRSFRFYSNEELTEFNTQVDNTKGFVPVSSGWIAGADEIPATRNAFLLFQIERAIPAAQEIKVPILVS